MTAGRTAELLQQPAKPAFVEHLVHVKSLREKPGDFGAQKQPFDIDVALRDVGCHYQETQPVHAALKSPISLLARYHEVTLSRTAQVFQ